MRLTSETELRDAILSCPPSEFVSVHLLESVPAVFSGNSRRWIEWKTRLAKMLEVDAYEIALIGSAAVGFSLNPRKRFAPFSASSDIDVAVVSSHHFDLAWRYLSLAYSPRRL